MAYPYFPVNVSAMTAEREFTEISGGETFQIDDAQDHRLLAESSARLPGIPV